jgi:restriction system protein
MTYEQLADLRCRTRWGSYAHPEDYGYDFSDLVSPYTRTAGNRAADIVIVLQDWISHEGITKRGFDPILQQLGHDPKIQTNIRLKRWLGEYLGLELSDVYGTNVFPFIKPGGMSKAIPTQDLRRAAATFTLPEIELVQPKVVVAFGARTAKALSDVGATVCAMPHPAARISMKRVDDAWRRLKKLVTK